MAAKILDGKKMSEELRLQISERVAELKQRGVTPGLAVILVGNDPASEIYVRNKEKGCAETGIFSTTIHMSGETSQQELEDQIGRLNADELYVLLMACYFHDTGMGITQKDYKEFSEKIRFGSFFETHSRDDLPNTIRSFHNEYSGLFIRKYAELFELPSEEHLWAVIQIARGHRKTDLMDEKQYPAALRVPDGNTVCLPYLSALIRLADEIDVAAARNPTLLYDIESLTDAVEIIENKKVKAVRELLVTEDEFVLFVDPSDEVILGHIRNMVVKMQKTLDFCRRVAALRTPYVITQQRVRMEEIA